MFIAQAFKVQHDFWRYLIGSVVIALAAFVGQLPLTFLLFYKMAQDGIGFEIDEASMYAMLDSNLFLFLMLISFLFGFLGLYLVVKHLHKQTMTSVATSRKKLDWKRIWFAFIFWGIISSGLVLIDYFYVSPENYQFNFEPQRFLILLVIAVALIPFQTSLEEYIFRGYLMQGFGTATKDKFFPFAFVFSIIVIPLLITLNILYDIGLFQNAICIISVIVLGVIVFQILKGRNFFDSNSNESLTEMFKRKWVPLVITSTIFGLLHIANPEIEKLGYSLLVYYIGTGLFLGILTLMDEGTELALGFHAANNLFTALLVTADWTAFQTHSILKDVAEPKLEFIDMVLPVFIIFPILLIIFSRVYKWHNWKEKLFGKVHEPPKEDYKIIGE